MRDSWPFPVQCRRNFWGTAYLPAPAVSLERSSDYKRPLVPAADDEFRQSPTGPTPMVPVIFSASPGIAYDFCRKWFDSRFSPW